MTDSLHRNLSRSRSYQYKIDPSKRDRSSDLKYGLHFPRSECLFLLSIPFVCISSSVVKGHEVFGSTSRNMVVCIYYYKQMSLLNIRFLKYNELPFPVIHRRPI